MKTEKKSITLGLLSLYQKTPSLELCGKDVEGKVVDCCGGDNCCFYSKCKCFREQGDCDTDAQCQDDLGAWYEGKCGTDNCKGQHFSSTDDCCEPKWIDHTIQVPPRKPKTTTPAPAA